MLTLFRTACFEVWHTVDVQYTAAINTSNVMFLHLSLQEGELVVLPRCPRVKSGTRLENKEHTSTQVHTYLHMQVCT